MKNVALISGLFWLSVLGGAGDRGLSAQEYKIIVNTTNPVASLSRNQLDEIFLKKTVMWEHGVKILPLNLSDSSPVRERFSRKIHGRSALAMQSYWQQKIFSGRGVPPPEKTSEKEVFEYVQSNVGAIGYVSGNAAPDKVKVLKITE